MNAKVIKKYYDYLCGQHTKQNTIRNKIKRAKQFFNHVNGKITEKTILEWRTQANQRYKKNTLNHYIQSINMFLSWLGKDKLRMKLVGEEDSNEYSLTEEEYEKVRIKCNETAETGLIFELLDAMVRPCEITDIKISNIIEDILYLDDTKTGNNHIVISARLDEAIQRYLKERPEPLPEFVDYLIISNNQNYRGQKIRTTLPIRNRILEAGFNAGIERRVKPYTIKRTSITLRLDLTSKYFAGDPKLVQLMARHKKLKTTMKYNRKDVNDIRQYHKSLNNLCHKKQKTSGGVNDIGYIPRSVIPQDLYKTFEREIGEDNSSYSFSFFSFYSFTMGGSDFKKGFYSEEKIILDYSDISYSFEFFPNLSPPPPYCINDSDTQAYNLLPIFISWDHMDGRCFSYHPYTPYFYITPSILTITIDMEGLHG